MWEMFFYEGDKVGSRFMVRLTSPYELHFPIEITDCLI